MADELTFVNTQVTTELDMKLRRLAAEQRVSRSEIVRIAIEKYLAEYTVVSIDVLPGPDDAEVIPVVTVTRKDE